MRHSTLFSWLQKGQLKTVESFSIFFLGAGLAEDFRFPMAGWICRRGRRGEGTKRTETVEQKQMQKRKRKRKKKKKKKKKESRRRDFEEDRRKRDRDEIFVISQNMPFAFFAFCV